MCLPSGRAARLRQDLAPSRFVVLCAGATDGPIAARDGIDTVILACAMLHQRHGIDAMLVVMCGERGGGCDGKSNAECDRGCDRECIGEPGGERAGDGADDLERSRLRQLARELDVTRHIRFAARRPPAALDDYHAAADVFASTPWHASAAAASAVARAMASALPVVGTAAIAHAATVRDGVTGHLVPPRDPETLCRCLARLQRQPLLARAMGMAGQAHAFTTPHRKTSA